MDTGPELAHVEPIRNDYPQLNAILEQALSDEYSVGRLHLADAYPAYFPSGDGSLKEGCTIILKMPFAGIFIDWGLTFCLTELETYPPIVTVLGKIHINKTLLEPMLMSWDISDKNCLSKLMKELRKLYNDHEVNKLKNNKFLSACFMELEEKHPKIVNNIEFAYIAQFSSFNVLLPLSLKTEDLTLANDKIKLEPWMLCSVDMHGSLQSHTLIMSQYLETLLENQLDKVTVTPANQTTSLSELVDAVTNNIQQLINATCGEHRVRRQFIGALLDLFPRNVAHYDSKHYRHGTLHFRIGEICYVAHFTPAKHELQIALFALNRLVTEANGREYPYCEELTMPLLTKPGDPDFLHYLHNTFVAHLDNFLIQVVGIFKK